MSTATRAPPRGASGVVTEAQFQQQVTDLLDLHGWLWYHTHDSRHSPAGFPDLVASNSRRTLFCELKASRGRLSPAQTRWVCALAAAGQEVYVWRPDDLERAERVMRGERL